MSSPAPSYLKKILTWDQLVACLEPQRAAGRLIVFTNGCFDLIHTGHTRYLDRARSLGDLLVVGLNSDESVRTIKGPGRPIRSQDKRAEVLAALESVSFVTLFEQETPRELILILRPDVLVKGADWAVADIVGAESVRESGGRVVTIPLVEDESTSGLIEQIKAGPAAAKDG